jgi:hypothetical protein
VITNIIRAKYGQTARHVHTVRATRMSSYDVWNVDLELVKPRFHGSTILHTFARSVRDRCILYDAPSQRHCGAISSAANENYFKSRLMGPPVLTSGPCGELQGTIYVDADPMSVAVEEDANMKGVNVTYQYTSLALRQSTS